MERNSLSVIVGWCVLRQIKSLWTLCFTKCGQMDYKTCDKCKEVDTYDSPLICFHSSLYMFPWHSSLSSVHELHCGFEGVAD